MSKLEEAAQAANLAIGGYAWQHTNDFDKEEVLLEIRAALLTLRPHFDPAGQAVIDQILEGQ